MVAKWESLVLQIPMDAKRLSMDATAWDSVGSLTESD
jgi:hypothetical protein